MTIIIAFQREHVSSLRANPFNRKTVKTNMHGVTFYLCVFTTYLLGAMTYHLQSSEKNAALVLK